MQRGTAGSPRPHLGYCGCASGSAVTAGRAGLYALRSQVLQPGRALPAARSGRNHVRRRRRAQGDVADMNTADALGDLEFTVRAKMLPLECADPAYARSEASCPGSLRASPQPAQGLCNCRGMALAVTATGIPRPTTSHRDV